MFIINLVLNFHDFNALVAIRILMICCKTCMPSVLFGWCFQLLKAIRVFITQYIKSNNNSNNKITVYDRVSLLYRHFIRFVFGYITNY